jgi:hypothetical protein
MYFSLVNSEEGKGAVECKLPTPLHLNEPHEIAVLAVDITQYFHNAPENGILMITTPSGQRHSTYFPSNVYSGAISVAQALNSISTRFGVKEEVKWSASDVNRTITLKLSPGYLVRFGPELQQFLGFSSYYLDNRNGEKDLNFQSTPDVLHNFQRITITCDDIEKNHCFNNSFYPVLYTIPIEQKDPNIGMLSFRQTERDYHRLVSNYLEKITAKFLDEKGRILSINKSGHLFILIHMRKCHNNGP